MRAHQSKGSASSSVTRGPGFVTASLATRSPWLKILRFAVLVTAAALVVMAIIAVITSGGTGLVSALIGWAVVALFFGVSLLVGHFAGKDQSSGAIGVFLATYVIKVLGFGAVLAFFAIPSWMSPPWFLISAVVTVLLWQASEVLAFSRTRMQIFPDPELTQGGQHE